MKKTLKIFAISLLSAAFFSCQDAELPVIENMVYISDAANNKIGGVNVGDEGTEIMFSVRLAKPADEDVKVTIIVDPSVLENYNTRNQTAYVHVDAEHIEAPALVVIPKGSVSSDPVKIHVNKFDMFAQYALSFKINSNGNVPVAEESSKYIIKLLNPLKQMVPKFNSSNAMAANPSTKDWGLELMNYTLEWWVKMSNFSVNNQAIINSGSNYNEDNSELYIRFGDLTYSVSGRYVYNFLQIKTMGSQFDTGNPGEGKGLTAGKWYHFAIAYDGNSGDSILYQDGVAVNKINTGAGRAMHLDRFQMCSAGSYFRDEAEMCQVRLWNTTRSATQILNNMKAEVDPTSPDLVMYLPMNEGKGTTVLTDVTGNGHDCPIGSLSGVGSITQAVSWEEYTF